MIRCTSCVMPNTRPDTPFIDGVCSACLSAKKQREVDWQGRYNELGDLLERSKNESGYDCIIPSSGGKDSAAQAYQVIGMGYRPLVVTATTCHPTYIGRQNIDALARHATTIEVTPNRTVRAKLNKIGLEIVGDISWPEHVAIFTTPFRAAEQYGIPLILYGENPQNQYGGPMGSEEAKQMTERWRSEFGGFLGLRVDDVIGMDGITARDMVEYRLPSTKQVPVEAHFLGQYVPWSARTNWDLARQHGFINMKPSPANWWSFENLDNAQTGIHDFFMWRKFGYGRAEAQMSVDIRDGCLSRDGAIKVLQTGVWPELDWIPERYAGVAVRDALLNIGVTSEHFADLVQRYTNWRIFRPTSMGAACLYGPGE
jgi:N-acetyl sugar amidotransferase